MAAAFVLGAEGVQMGTPGWCRRIDRTVSEFREVMRAVASLWA